MIETMMKRLNRLTREVEDITGFVYSVKCKTSDGLICTLNESRVGKDKCPECCTFPEYAGSEMKKEVLQALQLAETQQFLYSPVENVVVKTETIVRIWVELEYNEVGDCETSRR